VTVSTPLIAVSYDVEALRREQFPITRDTVYLNHAGISPIPQRTFDVMQDANQRFLLNPAGDFMWFMERYEGFKDNMRGLINAVSKDEIVGIQSTSIALNLVAQAITWERGQNIVLCDIEFPSNVYPWMRLQEQYGVEMRLVPQDHGGLTVEALARAVDDKTRLVAVSAVQFFTGQRADLNALGAFCHERGILFAVDAIQSAGHIPADVQASHIDIFVAGGLKSLMGPSGEGFLYVRSELSEQMRPTFVGANAVEDYMHWLKYKLTPLPGAARFNLGTVNWTGMVGLNESVTMLRELGIPAIDSYTTALADYLIDQLKARGYSVVTPTAHGPIVTFRARPTDPETDALVNQLKEQRIFVVKHWDQHDVAHVRASLHCYNTVADVDRLLEALKEN